MALNTPFDYGSILIGNEIIHRALKQQEKYAAAGEFGMTWNAGDAAAKSQAMDQSNEIRRNDFDVPPEYQDCVDDPPCPWDKTGDDLPASDLMPIVLAEDGVSTYRFKISQRTDSGTASYSVGPTIANYSQDQSKLDPGIQAKFQYYQHSSGITYIGKAIIIIKKIQNGSVQNRYTYLFNLI